MLFSFLCVSCYVRVIPFPFGIWVWHSYGLEGTSIQVFMLCDTSIPHFSVEMTFVLWDMSTPHFGVVMEIGWYLVEDDYVYMVFYEIWRIINI